MFDTLKHTFHEMIYSIGFFFHISDLSSNTFPMHNSPLNHSFKKSFQCFILGSILVLFYTLSLDDLNIIVSSTTYLLFRKKHLHPRSLPNFDINIIHCRFNVFMMPITTFSPREYAIHIVPLISVCTKFYPFVYFAEYLDLPSDLSSLLTSHMQSIKIALIRATVYGAQCP